MLGAAAARLARGLAAARPSATGVELFHGSPRDPVWDYVLSEQVALISILETTAPLVLVGHSHVALGARLGRRRELTGGLAPGGTEVELAGRRWLLNPGSVGQPRDGDPRAAWLLIDDAAGRATFRRVPYPIEQTQAEIRERGLPEALASAARARDLSRATFGGRARPVTTPASVATPKVMPSRASAT